MATYRVGITYVSWVEVEADNELEAVDNAVAMIPAPTVDEPAYIVLDEYNDPIVELLC